MKNLIYLAFATFLIISCNKKDDSKITIESTPEVTQINEGELIEKGQEIAMSSQKALGGQLMKKLEEGGPLLAMEFCSVQAIPITDSLSEARQVKITRVTDKTRNPNNVANKSQLDYMELVKKQLKNGEQPQPYLETSGENPQGYYPIVTNAMCLQCHGTPGEQMSQETFAKINELYPDDKAIGYNDNELRGIWVIDMMKE